MAAAPPISDQATENNQRLFRRYARVFGTDDPVQYTLHAQKLAVWLSDYKAYYVTARPEIIRLLLVAQGTLRRALGISSDVSIPFNIHDYPDNPLKRPYTQLVQAIVPFENMFVEPSLAAYIRALQETISNPAGNANSHHQPLFPSVPAHPEHLHTPSNTTAQSFTQTNNAAFYDPDIQIIENPNLSTTTTTHTTVQDSNMDHSTISVNKPSNTAPMKRVKKRKPLDLNALAQTDIQGLISNRENATQSSKVNEGTELASESSMLGPPTTMTTPSVTTPVASHPVFDNPIIEEPVEESVVPVVEEPVVEESVVKKSAMGVLTAGALSDGAEEIIEAHITQRTIEDKTVVEEPSSVEGPIVDEPVVEERLVEDRPAVLYTAPVTGESTAPSLINEVPIPPNVPINHIAKHAEQSSSFAPALELSTSQDNTMEVDNPQGAGSLQSNEPMDVDGCPQPAYAGHLQNLAALQVEPTPVIMPEGGRPSSADAKFSKIGTDSLRADPSLVFTSDMRVVARERGLKECSCIKIQFEITEIEFQPISSWITCSKLQSPEKVKSSICVSLGCYLSAPLLENNDYGDVFEARVAHTRSTWPHHGNLVMSVQGSGCRSDVPLAPPLQVTPDDLVDISSLVSMGTNVLELHQYQDLSQYMFVLHAHYPTEAQISQLEERCKKNREWEDWKQQMFRPLKPPLRPMV